MRKRAIVRALAFVVFLAATFGGWLGLVYWRYSADPLRPHAAVASPNAVWAGHQWVGRSATEADYDRLVATLRRHRITDVFFHAGPLDGDGRLQPARYPSARTLLRALKARYPELRAQAWLGQVEKRGGGPLDLANPATRGNILASVATVLALGFDGIHYNFEPLTSGNSHLLELLDRTREMTETRGKVLSMATDELEPVAGLAWLIGLIAPRGGFWNAGYYTQVARRVDQMAVMMYDTALPTDWLYGSLVAWETEHISRLAGTDTTVFIGVPSYEDRRFGFDPEAENVASALRGVRLGLARGDVPPEHAPGVAIYALWTTDAREWATYRRMWLGEGPQSGD